MKPATRRVLAFLRLRSADGATEEEIQRATGIRSGGQRVHELRHLHHFDIETVRERTPMGALPARWYLHEPPTFRAVSGVQEGLAL